MTDSIQTSNETGTETPEILDQNQPINQSSALQFNKDMLKVVKYSEYNNFYSYINRCVDNYKKRSNFEEIKKMLDHFQILFRYASCRLRKFLEENEENARVRFYKDKRYFDYLNDLLYLGIWDDDYANDPHGELSPFGKLLIPLQKYKGKRRIGIIHALEQQRSSLHSKNLEMAQKLAIAIHNHFWKFAKDNNFSSNLKPECKYPPIVQLGVDGAATLLGGLPVPAFIVIDKTKTKEFSDFSALPHECGHIISLAFKNSSLVKALTAKVKENIQFYCKFWEKWVEECLADAIAVTIIKEGEILSLANLFSNYPTHIIRKDCTGKEVDEHPVPYIRVLLTIEVGRLLSNKIDPSLLNKIETEWNEHRKKMSENSDMIINPFSKKPIKLKEFLDKSKPIVDNVLNIGYDLLGGKRVIDIFANFDNPLANKLTHSIKNKWLCKK